MAQKLRAKDITITETPDQRNLKILFEDNAMVDMLEFVEKTEVGKRLEAETNRVDSWDIERLDRSADEEEREMDDGVG
jgi:hypothetical protein